MGKKEALGERDHQIKELYLSNELTNGEIGERFGITGARVSMILREQGVQKMPYKQSAALLKKKKQLFEERSESMKTMYLTEDLSLEDVGARFGVTGELVRKVLSDLGVSAKTRKQQRFQIRNEKRLAKIKKMIEENPAISQSGIAKELNCCQHVVSRLLKKAGISLDRRLINSTPRRNGRLYGRIELTGDLLYRLYVTEEKTLHEIQSELGYNYSTISKNLKRLNIKSRIGKSKKYRSD